MRKIFVLATIIILAWVMSTWFLGYSLEKNLKILIDKNKQNEEKMVTFELINYRRNFLGASGEIILHSYNSYIDQVLEELKFDVIIKYGPIFINDSGLSIGESQWLISKTMQLKKDEEKNTTSLVKTKIPKAVIRIGFDKNAHYALSNNTMGFLEDMHGIYDLKKHNNVLSLSINGFQLELNEARLASDKLQLSFKNKAELTLDNSLMSVDFQTPRMKLQLKGIDKPIEASLRGKSELIIKKGIVSGSIHAELKKVIGTKQSVDSVLTDAEVRGLSMKGLIKFLERIEQISDLKHRITWVLEEQGELPEGHDQLWQHYDQIESLSQQLPFIVQNDILSSNSAVAFNINLQGKRGASTMVGNIRSAEKGNKRKMLKTGGDVLISKASSIPDSVNKSSLELVLAVLQGKAEIKLDDELYKVIVNDSAINRRRFNLLWKDNKLLMK